VTVRLTRDGGDVLLCVSDDGPGIPPAYHDKVFERFFRARGVGDVDGTGLGLAIVQSAASRMGASVRIVDGNPGVTVIVRFPPWTAN
jgi:two-component system sensor histidine kinase TctE